MGIYLFRPVLGNFDQKQTRRKRTSDNTILKLTSWRIRKCDLFLENFINLRWLLYFAKQIIFSNSPACKLNPIWTEGGPNPSPPRRVFAKYLKKGLADLHETF